MKNMLLGTVDRTENAVYQAVVFMEDAIRYKSIHHKVDSKSLKLYRLYYSWIVRWAFSFIIFVDLALAFFEVPSSLTISSDPRYRGTRPDPPCGVTESIELVCLLVFVGDLVIKSHLVGRSQFLRSRWLWAYCVVLVISMIDWIVSISYVCTEQIRVRRLLRPFFLLQNSSLMKKLLRAIKNTIPEVFSVLFLLFIHLIFFTMFGMLLFPREIARTNRTFNMTDIHDADQCGSESPESGAICEGYKFFANVTQSLRSLFVLLTTANNPDVMMPVYMKNRFYAIFFIFFTVVGLYCFLNLLTAVIYNQFRGYLSSSIQSSFFRRRVALRAAFEVLSQVQGPDNDVPSDHVNIDIVCQSVEKVRTRKRIQQELLQALNARFRTGHLSFSEFQALFDHVLNKESVSRRPPMSYVQNPYLRRFQEIVAHRYFDYFGDLMAILNVVLMSMELAFEYNRSFESSHSTLAALNFFFVMYYVIEQVSKLWALGWQRYTAFKGNLYCGVITIILLLLEIVHLAVHGSPFDKISKKFGDSILSMWNMIRIINMLIIFRLLRIIPNVQALSLVTGTLLNLLRNLRPFAGIIVAIYYIFAIFGMMLFNGVTDPTRSSTTIPGNYSLHNTSVVECGSFDQLEYFANNFDDFAASLVVLWDVMVVNNWHVFLKAYERRVNSWAQLYFLAWYLVSVVMAINLFVALILEAFITQWEDKQKKLRNISANADTSVVDTVVQRTVHFHNMFGSGVVEPAEDDVWQELRNHEHMNFAAQNGSTL